MRLAGRNITESFFVKTGTLLVLFASMTGPAFAYIDPNSGGLIMQIVTPLLLMIGLAWSWFRRHFIALKNVIVRKLLRRFGNAPQD